MQPQRLIWRGILVGLLAVVSTLALSPNPPGPEVVGWDKFNHGAAFAALAGSVWFAYPTLRLRGMVALFVYGGLIEIVQAFVPNRSAEWLDVLADAVGIGLGCAIAAAVGRIAPRFKR